MGLAGGTLQWGDAQAVLARNSQARRHWLGETRGGFSKTTDTAGFTIAAALGGLIPPGEKGFAPRPTVTRRRWCRKLSAVCAPQTRSSTALFWSNGTRSSSRPSTSPSKSCQADAPSAWGRRGWWWTVDEISSWSDTPGMHEFWTALSTAWPKVSGCRVVVISTAGSPAHFSRKLFETADAEPNWRLSDSHDVAPWIDAATIRGERRRLSEGTYGRLWENRWTQAEDHLVSEANLRRCVTVTDWPANPKPGTRYVIGVDLATKYDAPRSASLTPRRRRPRTSRRRRQHGSVRAAPRR